MFQKKRFLGVGFFCLGIFLGGVLESQAEEFREGQNLQPEALFQWIRQWDKEKYSISKKWKNFFEGGFNFEVYAGISHCSSFSNSQLDSFPLGGARISQEFEWGRLSADLAQVLSWGEARVPMFDDQGFSGIQLSGDLKVSPEVKLSWNCGFLITYQSTFKVANASLLLSYSLL